MSDKSKVTPLRRTDLTPAMLLQNALEESENAVGGLVVLFDEKRKVTIFATAMEQRDLAYLSFRVQDMVLDEINGRIEEV